MSGSTGTLWQQLRSGAPVCVILYSSLAALEEVFETVSLVAPPEWRLQRTQDVEDAFRLSDTPLLLAVENEAAAIDALDGRRDQLSDRSVPVILFLLKGGSGEGALRDAPGLASWTRGQAFDPEPEEIDVDEERTRFSEVTGLLPEAWLAAWRRGDIPDTLENNFLRQRALLLELDGGTR